MKYKIAFLLILFLSSAAYAAPTKSFTITDQWAEVTTNTIREGAITDISGCYAATLHISLAASTPVAHEGILILIQLSASSTGDESWQNLTSFTALVDTPVEITLTDDPLPAATTTIMMLETDVGNWEDEESLWIFILDGTVANSEMCLATGYVEDDSITIQDGTKHEHAQGSKMYDVADRFIVQLPITGYRVRVIYDNTKDADGTASNVHSMCEILKVTGL